MFKVDDLLTNIKWISEFTIINKFFVRTLAMSQLRPHGTFISLTFNQEKNESVTDLTGLRFLKVDILVQANIKQIFFFIDISFKDQITIVRSQASFHILHAGKLNIQGDNTCTLLPMNNRKFSIFHPKFVRKVNLVFLSMQELTFFSKSTFTLSSPVEARPIFHFKNFVWFCVSLVRISMQKLTFVRISALSRISPMVTWFFLICFCWISTLDLF